MRDEILELSTELVLREARRLGEQRHVLRMLEVIAPQPDHVPPRDRVAGRTDVDQSNLGAAGLGIDHL